MTTLLDVNVLIALAVKEHVHHTEAERWFARSVEPFAMCPITEGGLMRQLLRFGGTAKEAHAMLAGFSQHPRGEFWADSASYLDVSLDGLVGHRQVTDAYLAHLARTRNAKLATFDRGLASLHSDVAELVRTEPPVPPQPRGHD